MRAVVIGGSGQLGGWLLAHLRFLGHEAIGTFASKPYPGLMQLIASDSGAAQWVREQRPNVVFYPAGFTWVDECERDPSRARAANVEQPLLIARVAVESNARFVYFSTDYLFDGQSGPYGENDAPNPLNVYGASKQEAEHRLLSELGAAVLIARTCWVYGPERQGKNFAYQVVRSLRAGRKLLCPVDQFGNPSYGADVALATIKALEMGISGIVHIAGPNWINRLEFARSIAEAFELDAELLEGITTTPLAQGAVRPLRGGLRTERLESIVPNVMKPLRSGLSDFRTRLRESEEWANPYNL